MRGHRDLRSHRRRRLLCAVVALAAPGRGISLLFAAAAGARPARLRDRRGDLRPPRRRAPTQLRCSASGSASAMLALGGLVLNYLRAASGPWPGRCCSARRRSPAAGRQRCAARRRAARPRRRACPGGPRPATGLPLGAAALRPPRRWRSRRCHVPAKNAIGYTELWLLPTDAGRCRAGARSGSATSSSSRADYVPAGHVGDRPAGSGRRFALDPGEDGYDPPRRRRQPTGEPVRSRRRCLRSRTASTPTAACTGWMPRRGGTR